MAPRKRARVAPKKAPTKKKDVKEDPKEANEAKEATEEASAAQIPAENAEALEDAGSDGDDSFAPAHDLLVHRESLYSTLAPKWSNDESSAIGERIGGQEQNAGSRVGLQKVWQPALQPARMKSQLFEYQRLAVNWLATRERGGVIWHDDNTRETSAASISSSLSSPSPTSASQHLPVGLAEGPLLGEGRLAELATAAATVRGGLLADEMGLGKTLEVIGLILNHPFNADEASQLQQQVNDDADLPPAVLDILDNAHGGALPDCPATLIVCPMTLQAQWKNEIAKHAPDMSVLIYLGMGKLQQMLRSAGGPKTKAGRSRAAAGRRETAPSAAASAASVSNEDVADLAPARLGPNSTSDELAALFGNYDVVLTTYEVLRNEVFYVEDHSMSLRRAEIKYEKPKTPLIRTRFWRIILDEAQMVKAPTTQTARMGLYLSTYHRWCVSGTPLHRGFIDMKGLLRFLRIESQWSQPTERLLEFIRLIMLRRTKNAVGEIKIPNPLEQIELVPFSKMERFCYEKLQDDLLKAQRDADSSAQLKADQAADISAVEIALREHTERLSRAPELADLVADGNSMVAQVTQLDDNLRYTLQKFCSCPYIVIEREIVQGGKPGKKKARLDVERKDVLDAMIARGLTDFRRLQIDLVNDLNALAGAIIHTSKTATGEVDDASRDAAKEVYFKAFALAHQKSSAYFDCFGKITTGNDEVDANMFWTDMETMPSWRMAALHTLANMAQLISPDLDVLRQKLLNRADILKVTALEASVDSVRHSLLELRRLKRITSRIRDNRLCEPSTGGRWWVHALEWFDNTSRYDELLVASRAEFDIEVQRIIAGNKQAQADYQARPARARGSKPKPKKVPKFADSPCLLAGKDLWSSSSVLRELREGPEIRLNVSGSDISLRVAIDAESQIETTDDLCAWVDVRLVDWYQQRKRLAHQLQLPLCFYKHDMPAWESRHLNSANFLSDYESNLVGRGRTLVYYDATGNLKRETILAAKLSPEERVLNFIFKRLTLERTAMHKLLLCAWPSPVRPNIWANPAPTIDWDRVPDSIRELDSRLCYLIEFAKDHLYECSLLRDNELPALAHAWNRRDSYWKQLESVEDALLTETIVKQVATASAKLQKTAVGGFPDEETDLMIDVADVAKGGIVPEAARLHVLNAFEHRLRRGEGRCLYAKRDLEHLLRLNTVITPERARFGTKIEAAFKRVQKILAVDATAKILIFSQFSESLGQLAWLLGTGRSAIGFVCGKNVAGLPGTMMRGGTIASRIKIFKEDANVHVMLLNSTAASAGLTLTEANHVIMMDPARTASDDKQAVGRAYRIGQKQSTHIWRFAMIGSVEEEQTLGLAGAYEQNDDESSTSDCASTRSADGAESEEGEGAVDGEAEEADNDDDDDGDHCDQEMQDAVSAGKLEDC